MERIKDIPEGWRTMGRNSDGDLSTEEKETSITCPNDLGDCIIYTDVPTITKWIQSVEESDPVWLRTNEKGEIIGIKARIPKSIIKLQGNSRKSTSHSQMVTYGDMEYGDMGD